MDITLSGFINTLLNKIQNPDNTFYIKSDINFDINNHSFKIPYEQKVLFNPLNQKIKIVK